MKEEGCKTVLLPSSFFVLLSFLEVDANRQLYPTCVARRGVLAELRVGLLPRRVEHRGGVHGRELDVVERVVELGAELQPAVRAERNFAKGNPSSDIQDR